MIFDYGFSIPGKSHLQQDKPCQDAHYIRQLENGWFVGAVADGVGSCAHAEEGSAIAVKSAVDFVCECMPVDYSMISIKSMLRTAFNYALKQVYRHAEAAGQPAESYDTTLSLAIYDGSRIIYAHSGDGAVIGLTTFGQLVEITRRQKAEDGVSLIPLRSGYTTWEIDTYEEDLAGVLLVTDGVPDALSPYLLKISAPHTSSSPGLYMPMGSWLADPAGIPEEDEGRIVLKERMEIYVTGDMEYDSDFFYERLAAIYRERIPEHAEEILADIRKYNYPVSLMQGSQDDKTVVGFVNTEAVIQSQPADAYKEPDWVALQEAWNVLAYPSLYQEDSSTAPSEQEEKPSFLKWMKKWTRLDPQNTDIPEHAEEVSDDESCEVNTHEYDEHNETPDILQ